jgi:hypothetical protein
MTDLWHLAKGVAILVGVIAASWLVLLGLIWLLWQAVTL